MDKYIIKVNDIEYHSYLDLCIALNIDWKEFMKVKHENPDISQYDLLSHFYKKILIRMTDSSFFVQKQNGRFKMIKADCPSCLASCDDIVYQNERPIQRIYCSKCGLIYNENDAKKNGYDNVIDYWNHIGVYFAHD